MATWKGYAPAAEKFFSRLISGAKVMTDTETIMPVRPFAVRLGLMRIRADKRKANDKKSVAAANAALRNPDIMSILSETVCLRYYQDTPRPADWVDEVTALIKWMVDNADVIIELIIVLISIYLETDIQLQVEDELKPAKTPKK
jgi:hypothetical protein